MNRRDHLRLSILHDHINVLMDVPPQMNPVVTTAEIVEAIQWDIALILANKDIRHTSELIARDTQAAKS